MSSPPGKKGVEHRSDQNVATSSSQNLAPENQAHHSSSSIRTVGVDRAAKRVSISTSVREHSIGSTSDPSLRILSQTDITRRSRDSQDSTGSLTPSAILQRANRHRPDRWFEPGNIIGGIFSYIQRLFSFPLLRDPITFCRPGDFTTSGEPTEQGKKKEGGSERERTAKIEVLCNYDTATKELFENILKCRKEARASKDNYQFLKVDLSHFPGWNDTVIDRLRSTFQVFDISGDGFVDFEELSAVLSEFGDLSANDMRKKYFDQADIQKSGAIDFMEFIQMIYNLTMANKETDAATQALADSYRSIDRNMARIRGLDVVQQLQAGLF